MNKDTVLTLEGVAKLESKLEQLKTVRRIEVAERIKQAIAFGDLSENSEYDEAKNEQAFIEGEIMSIENKLRTAKIIDENEVNTDIVSVGVVVRVLDEEMNEETEYFLGGSSEANPATGHISNESPVGLALIGHKVGDEVEVIVPAGSYKIKILAIHKS